VADPKAAAAEEDYSTLMEGHPRKDDEWPLHPTEVVQFALNFALCRRPVRNKKEPNTRRC
jgi:hypothetical protein